MYKLQVILWQLDRFFVILWHIPLMYRIYRHIFLFIFCAICISLAPFSAYAQPAMKGISGPSAGKDGEKKSYPPGTAWSLTSPLGLHQESSIDTLLYNYQRGFVTAISTDAWASTGQLSSPGIDMIYFNRKHGNSFFFVDALERWVPTYAKERFYNVRIPMTLVSYNFTWGKSTKTDWLSAVFAGNINKRAGLGAMIDFPYTKGMYNTQATKELAFGLQGYYTGDRYEMQAYYNHYNHVSKENGGITDDRYITNPGEIQGGVTSVESTTIPVVLTAAHNRLIGSDLFMTHAYKLGFYRDISQPGDTVVTEEFVPVTKFIYAFNYRDNDRFFINTAIPSIADYWQHTYFDASRTEDDARYWSVSNTLGVELIEGFQHWAKFGLSAYAQYDIDRYWYSSMGADEILNDDLSEEELAEVGLDALPEGFAIRSPRTRHRLWVGGRIEKTRGSVLRYNADAKVGLVGDAAGELDIRGNIITRFRVGRDTMQVSAHGFFKNLEPNYFYKYYLGNHFAWSNDFGKTRSMRAEGRLYIPWSRTTLRAGVENIQNQIYFDADALPRQYSGHIQVVSAALQQDLKFGIWNWNNTVTWQRSSRSDILPMPEVALYSNMFLGFKAFRALTVQVGIDCNYYMKYRGYAYQPALMAFVQQGADAVDLGGYAFSNVYLTCKLYKVRFFVMGSNITQNWFQRNHFALPHYPMDPRQFRCGLSIDFSD